MTYLQYLIAEAMGLQSTDVQVAKIAEAIERRGVIDQAALKRSQIQDDPCRDHKIIQRRYRVSTATVYRAWNG